MGSIAFQTLLRKELLRCWRVAFQTIAAPVLTALLYLLVFSHILEDRIQVYAGISYTLFLIPGLVMMAVLQNAFANSSSSLIQSKISGSIIFIMLPPLTHFEFFAAYLTSSLIRGVVVGLGVWVTSLLFVPHLPMYGLWAIIFCILGAWMFSTLGLIGGLWAEKFEQLASVQNFIIMPLTFLSGVFYSTHSLSPFWKTMSHIDPVFYIIDGFRYGFFGVSDVSPWLGLVVVTSITLILTGWSYWLIYSGYRLRH